MSEIKDNSSGKANEIKEGLSNKANDIKEGITGKTGEIKQGITNKTNAIKQELADTTNDIRQGITDKKNAIKEDIAETKENINTSIDKGKKAVNRFFRKLFIGLLLFAVLAGIAYYIFASMTYSDGSRTGQLIKISEKGYVFKTYEGQLSLGGISVEGDETNIGSIWEFSVANNGIYDRMQALRGKKVLVQYEEKYRVLPWRGDTKYIIINVEEAQ